MQPGLAIVNAVDKHRSMNIPLQPEASSKNNVPPIRESDTKRVVIVRPRSPKSRVSLGTYRQGREIAAMMPSTR
jgi:hypothetical protein